ncbi:MAG: hypothetical protein HWD62_02060 [Cyclobacteriaceae bacterium]|nr:MAG: hypothetical protein HWD62_02060 [Cyclobacteriaceae bacterium]
MGQFDNFEVCDHPFETFVRSNSKVLVIGTFPTHPRNYKHTFKFYYAGVGNQFWPVLEKIYNHSFRFDKGEEAINERKLFLEQKGIAITDMLEKAYRKNGRSQDEYIYPIVFNKIFSILEKYPTIDIIILTSRTKIIGALGLFETYLLQNGYSIPKLSKGKILEGSFKFKEREIEILVPYSTSNTIIEEQRATFNQLVEMYRTCLT